MHSPKDIDELTIIGLQSTDQVDVLACLFGSVVVAIRQKRNVRVYVALCIRVTR